MTDIWHPLKVKALLEINYFRHSQSTNSCIIIIFITLGFLSLQSRFMFTADLSQTSVTWTLTHFY